jgi:hypothetical protein
MRRRMLTRRGLVSDFPSLLDLLVLSAGRGANVGAADGADFDGGDF